MAIQTPANLQDRMSRVDTEVLESLATALNAPDLSKNKYTPENEYGGFLARTGADFALRIKEQVNAGKIATTILQKGALYAHNPLPGMIINPAFPFLGPAARPEAGRNLNTLDGAVGLNYERITQVGGTISEELQNTGLSIFGNLIEEAPAAYSPGPSGPNKNFIPRASPVERVENVIEAVVKNVANSFKNKFINSSGFGRNDQQWSDRPGSSEGMEFIGKYGEGNVLDFGRDPQSIIPPIPVPRWTDAQEKSLKSGDINVKGFSIPNPFSPSANQKFAPKNELPEDWTQYDKTYDDGSSVETFEASDAAGLGFARPPMLSAANPSPWEQTLPLTITDLRNDTKIYFKAFLENLTEKYNPNWETYQVFARPEPYYQWKNCTRQFSFRLRVFAFSPPELNVIYRKLNFLSQLQYGTYHTEGDKAGSPKNPPLCRLRLGDLIKNTITSNASMGNPMGGSVAVGPGLAGWISGLGIEYPIDSWEMEAGSVVPKSFTIDIEFNVIHETPVSGEAKFYDVGANTGIGKSGPFKKMFEGVT